jgi:hypothetical protein
MKRIVLAATAIAVCLAQKAVVVERVIDGTLIGDDGSAVTGGGITLERLPPYPRTVKHLTRHTTSDEQGKFTFKGLAEGRYRLCVHDTSGVWLNPCVWGKAPEPFSIPATFEPTKVKIVMARGAKVPIRIADSGQLLSLHEGKTAGAHVLIGVGSDGVFFVPAALKGRDADGANFEVLIPFNVAVNLVVSSAFFSLKDPAGVPLSKSGVARIPLLAQAGRSPDVVRLTLTGASK